MLKVREKASICLNMENNKQGKLSNLEKGKTDVQIVVKDGENGVITKYRKGLGPTNEFIETVKYGEGWYFKIDYNTKGSMF